MRWPNSETPRRSTAGGRLAAGFGVAVITLMLLVGTPVAAVDAAAGTAVDAAVGTAVDSGVDEVPIEPLAAATTVRVGLATDLEAVGLCCDPRLEVRAGREILHLDPGVVIKADPAVRSRAVYRLQVAALKDERQAHDLARRLTREAGQPADAIFDADRDLYRVRFGRFDQPQAAEAQRGTLAALGVEQSWLVNEGGAPERAAFVVEQAGRGLRVEGRWLAIEAPPDVGIPFARGRYRGRLLVFLNDRGLLNVVNELPVEDYLRGVVPREMGPELYDEIEALKAQSVAARTFALRNLGEFAAEGYDICSTPRCQVYGGMAVEHPVSDRAIAETAGEVVLVDGEPGEIFFSATCGGHTEDVEVVFPHKHGRHLRGVPCFEAGAQRFADRAGDAAGSFIQEVMARLLPPPPGRDEQVLSARLEHLALLAGLPPPRDQLASLAPADVHRHLASFLDLALDARFFGDPGHLDALIAEPPGDWNEADQRLARRFRDLAAQRATGDRLSAADADALLYELAQYLDVLGLETVDYLRHDDDALIVRRHGAVERLEIPDRLIAGERRDSAAGRTDPVRTDLFLVPGDPLEILRHRDRLLAVLLRPLAPPIRLGHRAERATWRRVRSGAEVKRSVQARYPGFPFEGFQVLSRGVSGRVARMRLLGAGGRTLMVDGLAVRWTLDLPDTWFDAERTAGGGWTFSGHGWGHGVGMCQAGSFGMAARGADYRRILEHYFSGAVIGRAPAYGVARTGAAATPSAHAPLE